MPKAPAFSEDEEKTTIESGWEEEASTTLEEGDVASRIRALNGEVARAARNTTGITNTNGSGVEEPTIDDQRANAAISMITPPSMSARLLITQGNDTGQDLEVIPGKSYTIGRAIENDFVLTDIAVSRKHFDLRFDGGSWLLADRGSGNGTLINGNIEDQPFLLANGDLIEIGNTTFRFEQAGGTPRPVAGTYDISVDEDEPSTLAGKPLRSTGEVATPSHVPPSKRPKTVPPPAPLPRARHASTAPPVAYPSGSQTRPPMPGMPPARSQPQQAMSLPLLPQQVPIMPASTLPMPQMANRPPLASPGAPTMLGDPKLGMPMPNAMPTIPGQGPPLGPPQQMQALPYGYPNLADLHKQHQGPMLVVGNGTGRDATSTALVQPAPYGVMSAAQQLPPRQGKLQLSRRTRLTLAATGLAILAAVATIAIIKGASGGKKDDAPKSDPLAGEATKVAVPAKDDQVAAKVEPPRPEPRKTEPPKTTTPEPKPGPKVEPPKVDPPQVEAPAPAPAPIKAEPSKVETDPPKADPPKADPPKADPPKAEPPAIAKTTPPKADPPRVRAETRTKNDPPKRRTTAARTTPPPRDPPKAEPEPKDDPAPKRIAVADSSEAKNRASELYRTKRFNDAGQLLRKAAAGMPADATDLRSIASVYEQLGRAYNRGMAQAAKPVEAFAELRKAFNLDSGGAGGAFKDEIQARLAQVAPRAAISFFGSKDYEAAYQALRTAEQFGSTSGDLKLVRQGLEAIAVQLYNAASKEISSNADEAKTKLRQVKAMVDPKSAIWVKANKLLTSS